jgi:hypothetical protein
VTDNIPNVPTITIGQVPAIIKSAYTSNANNQQVPSFEGDPGNGKTAAVEQAAEDLGIGCVVFSAPLMDPATSAGLPTPVKDAEEYILHWANDSRWPRERTHGERGILFIDEFWAASPFVKNAMSGLIHGGKMGSYTLPKGWMIVVAGNLMTNKAGVTQTGSHIKSRLERYKVTTAFNAVKKYWTDRGLNIKVLAFLDQHGDKLSTFSPDAELYASPRGWEKVAHIIDTEKDVDVAKLRAQATVGVQDADALFTYLNSLDNLPKRSEILKNPSRARLADDPGDAYALLSGLAANCGAGDADAVVAYVQRYPEELQATFVSQAKMNNTPLFNTSALTKLNLEVVGA